MQEATTQTAGAAGMRTLATAPNRTKLTLREVATGAASPAFGFASGGSIEIDVLEVLRMVAARWCG